MSAVALIGGTGRSGPALAQRLSLAGTAVIIGSRDADRAAITAVELTGRLAEHGGGAPISGADNATAVTRCAMAIVTVPFEAQAAVLHELEPALRGRIVVSTAIPVSFDPHLGPVAISVEEGSASEQVASLLPGSRVVGALHTVSNVHLARLQRHLDEDVLVTGDDGDAKATVIRLIESIAGLRAIDAGRLANSAHCEHLTVILLTVNRHIKRSVGIRLTNLTAPAAP